MPNLHELFGIRERHYKCRDERWSQLIGVELELEGVKNAREIPFWTIHQDGSLRDGVEYVLAQPTAGMSLDAAMDEFFGARLICANTARTSTHIHINMTDASLDTLRCMTMLMYMIEEPLFNIVGESRKWAGYAMPLSDMEPTRLRQLLAGTALDQVAVNIAPARNQERYYGFNTASMRKHGTVEFRYYPGGPSREELENWIDLAIQIKKAGAAMDPAALCERLSDPRSIVDFLSEYLSDYWMNNLLQQVDAQFLLMKFNEVATLAHEQEQLERRENLVFLTPPFMTFVKTNLLANAGRMYIDGIREAFEVLSVGDWYYHFREAEERDAMAGQAVRAPKVDPLVTAKKPAYIAGLGDLQAAPANVYGELRGAFAAEAPRIRAGESAMARREREYQEELQRIRNEQPRVRPVIWDEPEPDINPADEE